MLFAPGTIAAKNFGFRCWALALARLLRTLGRRVRRRRIAGLGCRYPQAFSPTRPVLAVLSLAFCPTVGSPPIPLAGPSSPPESSLGAALRATVSGLGMCGVKGFLAALEQTVSLPRLTCPLTGISLVASLMWAQGSCELPTAKSRTRSFLPPLRGAFLDHDPPIGRPLPSKYTTTNPRVQATRVGTRPLKPTGYRLLPHSLEEWCPRSLLLTRYFPFAQGSWPFWSALAQPTEAASIHPESEPGTHAVVEVGQPAPAQGTHQAIEQALSAAGKPGLCWSW